MGCSTSRNSEEQTKTKATRLELHKQYEQDFILPVPLLIIYGDADSSGKVQSYCRQWAEREKRPLKIIADAAHNSNMDNPDEFNRILGEFLKKTK